MLWFNSKKKKINQFWEWFEENQDVLSDFENDKDKKFDLILEQLRKVQTGLAVEVSVKGTDKTREIIISADGDKNNFSIVKEIVAKAPSIESWKITAFRQRINEVFTIKVGDLELCPAKLFFHPEIENDNLDIIVYGPDFEKLDKKHLFHTGLIMLDNLLGEYDCVIKVRRYNFKDIAEVADESYLKKLSELPDYIDGFYKNRTI